jgi:hypothetical protein
VGERESRLVVFVDGKPLADAEARALWTRFSRHMDQYRGDLGGFAVSEGFASVRPESRAGKAVLIVSSRRSVGRGDRDPSGSGSR